MSGKQSILDRIRSQTFSSPGLPDLDVPAWIQYDDVPSQFADMVEAVGGQCTRLDRLGDVGRALAESEDPEAPAQPKRVLSMVPEAIEGNVDPARQDDPHALADLDLVVARGDFGVAENGAVWVRGSAVPQRVALFITQHLALVIGADDIVPHMHEAYRRLGRLEESFGVFISGPSKTADIEQSLVLGAHGCRSLRVFVVGGARD